LHADTNINAGAIQLNSVGGLYSNNVLDPVDGYIYVESGASLILNNNIDILYGGAFIRGSGVSNRGALCNLSGNNWLYSLFLYGNNGTVRAEGGNLTVSGITSSTYRPTFTAVSGSTISVIAAISGSGGLTVGVAGDNGTVTLSAANTFTGTLTVGAGTLSATTSNRALGSTLGGAISVANAATLSLGVAVSYNSRSLAISGTGSSSSPNNGSLIIANTGTNTFSDITLGASAYIRATVSGTLTLTNSITTDSATGKNLTVGAASGVTFALSVDITGGGTLTLGNHSGDTGTVKFSGSNTIGNTSIAYGTAQAGNTNAFGSTGTVSLLSGATLQTLTTGGQNGKLTVAALNNASGGTIKIGG
jgi:autotransporter-associated beta strand protein